MADFGIYTKNADIAARAGDDVSATAIAIAATDVYVLNVEGFINSATRYNWSDVFAGLNAEVSGILTETGACLCAIYALLYKPSGETGNLVRIEFEDRINILRDIALRNISILRDAKTQKFINAA